MTGKEKEEIKIYRNNGMSYFEISKKLGISINTIKSYCLRNGIKVNNLNKSLCRFCGKEINQELGRKKKKFCSDKCRGLWWKEHSELINKKTNYECTCIQCGKTYISYGNSNRKYCCHDCYIKSRFGDVHHDS